MPILLYRLQFAAQKGGLNYWPLNCICILHLYYFGTKNMKNWHPFIGQGIQKFAIFCTPPKLYKTRGKCPSLSPPSRSGPRHTMASGVGQSLYSVSKTIVILLARSVTLFYCVNYYFLNKLKIS